MGELRLEKNFSLQRLVPVIVIFALVFSLLPFSLVERVEASTSRSAEFLEVYGAVYVTKAGGARSLVAYEGMLLQHGDHIKTGEQSSAIIRVLDRGDEITISEKADLYISDLRDESGNKKTSFFLWSGSIWVDATALITPEDTFEIHTPTSVMSVRGTHFFVGVNPETGFPTFMVGSGMVNVMDREESTNPPTTIYPSQQAPMYNGQDTDPDDRVSIISLEQFINNANPAIIEALLKNKPAMDQENAEFIARMRELLENEEGNSVTQDFGIRNMDDLNRLQSNLDNLIANIVNKAIEQKIVDAGRMQQIIDQVNASLDKKIDLRNVPPLTLTEEEKARQEQLRKLEEKRRQLVEEQRKKQEDLKNQNQNQQLLDRLNKQRMEQEEANRKAKEDAKRKAEEELKNRLDEQERQRFEQQKQALEERQRQQTPAPTPPPEPNPDPVPAPDPIPDPDPVDTTPPDVVIVSPTEGVWNNTGNVNIVLRTEQGATVSASVYGYETPHANGIGAGFSTDVTLSITGLDEGEHLIHVTATDAAGNVTTIELPVITIDTQPPTISYMNFPIGELTTVLQAEIYFIAEKGATLQIIAGDIIYATGIGRGLGEDDVVEITLPFLEAGDYYFTIKAFDAAGNETIYPNEDDETGLFHLHVYTPGSGDF